MTRNESGRLGALIKAVNIRNKYQSNPNHCQWCGSPIALKDNESPSEARSRKYCNRSCAASFNNQRPKRTRKTKACSKCFSPFWSENKSRKWCDDCQLKQQQYLATRTKADVSRQAICKYARESITIVKCQQCGYDKFVDVSHIKAVKDFPNSALLSEINHPSNLLCLCPNHHHEYDYGLLTLNEILLCTK